MQHPVLWQLGGDQRETWRPTSVRELGKDEAFLERVISEEPRLLSLEGISGPFAAFNQLSLTTPLQRSVAPDVVFLTGDGHVVVVEVKLRDNPEIRDRDVIAQVVDYASALTECDESRLLELFATKKVRAPSWEELVDKQHFPKAANPRELAAVFLQRFQDGDLHLVVACDAAPPGLRDLARRVTRQSALGFTLQIAEITPYVRASGKDDAVLFLPVVTLATEIVARSAVTVSYDAAKSDRPGVKVVMTSAEDVERALEDARSGGSTRHKWTEEDFLEQFQADIDPRYFSAVQKLVAFARKNHGGAVTYGTGASPTFNPRLPGFGKRSVFTLNASGRLIFNFGFMHDVPGAEMRRDQLIERVASILGEPRADPGEFLSIRPDKWTGKVDAILIALADIAGLPGAGT